MPHNKERKEKICLNCNAAIYGRYCHVCGQENIEPKEKFWHIANHFIEDVTHFDGKFFSTLKYLLFRPGFLSKEYLRGRRVSYLHPIRMYVFTSAVFFFIYFFIHQQHKTKKKEDGINQLAAVLKDTAQKKIKDSLQKTKDTAIAYTYKVADTSKKSHIKVNVGLPENYNIVELHSSDDGINDSVTNKKAGFLVKAIKKYRDNQEEIQHKVPQVMFCTLPLMGLVLLFLYRKQKQLLYVSHLIFIIHLFNAIYIMYLVQYGVDYLGQHFWTEFFKALSSIIGLLSFFYVYKSLRNFYRQRRFKTFVKCCLLFMFFWIIFLFVYVVIISPTLYT